MHSLDIFVQNYFALVRTTGLTEFMYLLTILFDFSVPFILIIVGVAVLIRIVRSTKYALLFVFSLTVGGICIYFLKLLFNINRPTDGVMDVFGKSFPSGHTTIVVIFFVMLMYIFDRYFSYTGRIVFNTFCIALVILVSFSRLYLGVHWLSDVIGGIILGGILSYLSVLIFKYFFITQKRRM